MYDASKPLYGLWLASLAALVGCASGQTSGQNAPWTPSASALAERAARARAPLPAQQPAHRAGGWLAPAARSAKRLIYVSDFSANVVRIYPVTGSNPAPIGEITDGISGPEGCFADAHGNLFVSNVTNYTVTMYPKGSTTWKLRYTGLAYPTNVAAGKDGMVYIPDLLGDKVVEYRKGSTRSKRTIAVTDPQGVTLDAQNDLYVSYNTSAGGQANEYPPGSVNGINLGLPISFAGGDAVDGNGNLVAADQIGVVNVFPPGATTPSRTITQGMEDPFRIAFDRHYKNLYVADPEVNALLIYDYATGTLTKTITNQLTSVYGVAVSPGI